MLELLNLDQQTAKEDYQRIFPDLALRLGACQRAAREAGIPVLIVWEGWDAAGKGTAINRLAHALDPRGFQVHLTGPVAGEDPFFPWMRRFWNILPAAGLFAIYDHSWYRRVLADRIEGLVSPQACERAYEEILEFERMQVEAGAVVVKFWMHIDRAEQKRRFRRLAKHSSTAWKVGKAERKQHRRYDLWWRRPRRCLSGRARRPRPGRWSRRPTRGSPG